MKDTEDMNRVRVEIGGIGILFRHKNLGIKEERIAERNTTDFIWPGKADLIIDIRVSKIPYYSRKRLLFEAKENWRLYEDGRRYIYEMFDSSEKGGSGIMSVCFMETKSSEAELYIRPETKAMTDGRNFSLEQVMRILGQLLIISILHRYDGVLIHSSGVILNGEGLIFAGISGSGKTTISKLWRKKDGFAILSDDRVIIRKERAGYFVYGTPWPGEGRAASSKKAPLKRIFFLSKAQDNTVRPISRKESLHQLVTQCFPALWDKAGVAFFMEFCGKLVRSIPCNRFGFVPDKSAVEFIEGAANRGLF